MTRTHNRTNRPRAGFTLVELLVVMAIVALLSGLLLPAMGGVRGKTREVKCLSNLRQMGMAWMLYANNARDRAMPLAYWSLEDIGSGQQVFWWGTHGTASTSPNFERGFLAPYMASSLHDGSVFECPDQPWGTYRPQGPSGSITSTYGYNGYYLSPAKTPGWALSIGHRPWRRVSDIARPSSLFVFADTLLPGFGNQMPSNNALLDPPMLFNRAGGGRWRPNSSPTTAFRHAGTRAALVHADGHAAAIHSQADWLTHPNQGIGSVGGETGLAPGYIPDWAEWRSP